MIDFIIYELSSGDIIKWGSTSTLETAQLQVGEGQGLIQGQYVKNTRVVDGEIVSFTPPPIDYGPKNRAKRNALLTSTDYTQILDNPLTDEERTLWATYRQNLRDLPSTLSTFNTVELTEDDLPTRPL